MSKELSPEVCIEFRNADKGDRYVDMAWLDLTVTWANVPTTDRRWRVVCGVRCKGFAS